MKTICLFLTYSVVFFAFANSIPNHYNFNDKKSFVTFFNNKNSNLGDELLTDDDNDKRYKRDEPVLTEKKPVIAEPKIYSIAITSDIRFRYAQTVISHRIANPANVSQEVGFTVTLPESAFISKFLMIIKDKEYEAYVKEKDEAKKDYQEAVSKGISAGHVEQDVRDSNTFTVSVNVEPLSKVTFNLTYEQLLRRTLGLYENVMTIYPGQVVKSLSVEVNIEESSNITDLDVPDFKTNNEIDSTVTENKLAVIERNGNKSKITWNPTPEQQLQMSADGAKGQFIVRYDVDRVSNPNQILVDEGYFVHFYAPSDLKTLRKHVVFTLDVSGSMQGRKIEQLREALQQILGDISETDFFTLVLFSDSVELWSLNGTYGQVSPTWYYGEERPVTQRPEIVIDEKFIIPATAENIAKAKEFSKTLNETGGTNIIAALRRSLELSQWGQKNNAQGAEPLIIFLTDGEPNVEMSDPEEIIKTVRKQNTEEYPIFSLAFGEGADYNFLRKLSLSSNGFARNIYVASDTSLQLKNFYKQVASPLLSNVSFQYIPGQLVENTTTKSVFNNLFSGSELIVAGKLADGMSNVTGNLSAHAIDGDIIIPFPEIIICPPRPEKPINKSFGHLEKLWAFLYIQELLDLDAVSDDKNNTYKEKALNLSLRYSFVTPLTSLVVIKPNETESSGAPVKPAATPVDGSLQTRLSPLLISAYPVPPAAAPGVFGPTGLAYPISVKRTQSLIVSGSSLSGVFAPQILYSAQIHYSTTPNYNPTTLSLESYAAYDIIDTSTLILSSNVTSENLTISDITWLNSSSNEVTFPSSNNTYSVATDLPNMEFQPCVLPNKKVSHCRHLAHCVLPNIISSFEDFIPYGESCVIDARFVGICCPPERSVPASAILTNDTIPSSSESATSTISSTSTTPTIVV